jgi:hypothetical protein
MQILLQCSIAVTFAQGAALGLGRRKYLSVLVQFGATTGTRPAAYGVAVTGQQRPARRAGVPAFEFTEHDEQHHRRNHDDREHQHGNDEKHAP